MRALRPHTTPSSPAPTPKNKTKTKKTHYISENQLDQDPVMVSSTCYTHKFGHGKARWDRKTHSDDQTGLRHLKLERQRRLMMPPPVLPAPTAVLPLPPEMVNVVSTCQSAASPLSPSPSAGAAGSSVVLWCLLPSGLLLTTGCWTSSQCCCSSSSSFYCHQSLVSAELQLYI